MAVYTIAKSGITLVAATVETLLMVTSVTDTLRVLGWGVSFDSVSSDDVPALVNFARATTAGTATACTADIAPAITSNTPSATAQNLFTAEPTVTKILESHYVTPNGGLLVMQYSTAEAVRALDTERLVLRATAPTSNVNASAWITFEENF